MVGGVPPYLAAVSQRKPVIDRPGDGFISAVSMATGRGRPERKETPSNASARRRSAVMRQVLDPGGCHRGGKASAGGVGRNASRSKMAEVERSIESKHGSHRRQFSANQLSIERTKHFRMAGTFGMAWHDQDESGRTGVGVTGQ